MTVPAIGILILALICAWTFGGIALRLAGALIALAGLLGLSLSGKANGLLAFALGACLWLVGHLHFRLRPLRLQEHARRTPLPRRRLGLPTRAGDRDQRSAAVAAMAVRSQRCGR